MNEFYFLQYLAEDIEVAVNNLTDKSNVFIQEFHIEPGKTHIKYQILSTDGFLQKEIKFFNKIKQ